MKNRIRKFNESEENFNSDTSSSISDVSRSFTIEDLRKAFNDAQDSIEIKMKQKPSYDEDGDMVITLIADKETNKNFDAWYRENYL